MTKLTFNIRIEEKERKMVYKKSSILILSAVLVLYVNAIDAALFPDHSYFAGINISRNLRKSNYKLSNGFEQAAALNNMISFGVFAGKKYDFFSNMRFQFPLMFNYGFAEEDTLEDVELSNGETEDLLLSSTFFHLGFIPQLQYCIPVTNQAQFYFSGGGGLHYTKIKEKESIIDQPEIRIVNDDLIEENRICFSADAGVGFEFLVKKIVLSFQYTFRYWKPVDYKMSKDLFPLEPVNYSEYFFSHNFQMLFFIKNRQL